MAKFDPCSALPPPGPYQGIRRSSNRFGCFYSTKNDRPKMGGRSRQVIWRPIMNGSPFDLTRQFMRTGAHSWKFELTNTERELWQAYAETATIYRFDGGTNTPNGFEAFIKNAKYQNFFGFNPYFTDVQTFQTFPPAAPTAAWTELPTPHIHIIESYGDGAFGVGVDNSPVIEDLFLLGQIGTLANPNAHPAQWYMAWIPGQSLDPYDPDTLTFWQTDYPLYRPGTNAAAKIACFFYGGEDYSWGPYAFANLIP